MSATKAMQRAVKTASTDELHRWSSQLLDLLTPTTPEYERNALRRSSYLQQRETVLAEIGRRYAPKGGA